MSIFPGQHCSSCGSFNHGIGDNGNCRLCGENLIKVFNPPSDEFESYEVKKQKQAIVDAAVDLLPHTFGGYKYMYSHDEAADTLRDLCLKAIEYKDNG